MAGREELQKNHSTMIAPPGNSQPRNTYSKKPINWLHRFFPYRARDVNGKMNDFFFINFLFTQVNNSKHLRDKTRKNIQCIKRLVLTTSFRRNTLHKIALSKKYTSNTHIKVQHTRKQNKKEIGQ